MKIEVTNQQSGLNVDEDAIGRYAAWIMARVQELEPRFHWTEVSVVLTDDRIRDLNRAWFQRDRVTDVISFAYPDAGFGGGDTGEIIVNVRQAWEEGNLRTSPDDELALYIAHGCHHLMGADDDTPPRRQAMLRTERNWIRRARAHNLVGPFFP